MIRRTDRSTNEQTEAKAATTTTMVYTACRREDMYHHSELPSSNDKFRLNGETFVDNLTVLDCSKVSDGASSIIMASEEGLAKLGIDKKDAAKP